MRVRVLHVRVLVGLPAARRLRGEPVRHRVIGVRMVRRDGRRADHHLGAVGPQHRDLVLADLVRADEQAAVALLLRDDGQADAGVAGRGLHDGAAGLQLARLLGGLDHAQRDPVLDRAARVEVLDLGEHPARRRRRASRAGDLAQPQQRGVPDQIDQRVVDLHLSPPCVSDPRARGPVASAARRYPTAEHSDRSAAADLTAAAEAWPAAAGGQVRIRAVSELLSVNYRDLRREPSCQRPSSSRPHVPRSGAPSRARSPASGPTT